MKAGFHFVEQSIFRANQMAPSGRKKNYGHTPSLITNRSTKICAVFSTKNHNSLISKYKKPQMTVT
jgi:hypothetical protein